MMGGGSNLGNTTYGFSLKQMLKSIAYSVLYNISYEN